MGIRMTYLFPGWDQDDVTVTASSEESDKYEAENVSVNEIGKHWRSTGLSGEWLKFDLGSARQVNCLGIVGHNLTSLATVSLQAHSGDFWSPPAYNQTLTLVDDADGNPLPYHIVYLDETYRWWRIVVSDATNPDGYLKISWVKGGLYWEPDRTFGRHIRVDRSDPSAGDDVPGQDAPLTAAPSFRRIRAGFPRTDQTQFDRLDAMYAAIGRNKPLLLSWNPTTRPVKDSMYCRIQTDMSATYQGAERWDYVEIVFQEKTR